MVVSRIDTNDSYTRLAETLLCLEVQEHLACACCGITASPILGFVWQWFFPSLEPYIVLSRLSQEGNLVHNFRKALRIARTASF